MNSRRVLLWLFLALAFVGRPPAPVSAGAPKLWNDFRAELCRVALASAQGLASSPNPPDHIRQTDETLVAEPFTRGHRLGTAPSPRSSEVGSESRLWDRSNHTPKLISTFHRFANIGTSHSRGASSSTPRAPPLRIDPYIP